MEFDFVTDIARAKECQEILNVLKDTLVTTEKDLEEKLTQKEALTKELSNLSSDKECLQKEVTNLEENKLHFTNDNQVLVNEIRDNKDTLTTLKKEVGEIEKTLHDAKIKKEKYTALVALISKLEEEKAHIELMISGHSLKLKSLKEDIDKINVMNDDLAKREKEFLCEVERNQELLKKIEYQKANVEEIKKKNDEAMEYLGFATRPISYYIRGLQKALDKQAIKFSVLDELNKIK
jgi:chromosome segregation ATPase